MGSEIKFIHPADPKTARSGFGIRPDPFTGKLGPHKGIDYAIARNTPIFASESGTITTVGTSPSYGNFIIITHDLTFKTLYAHLNKINVKVNQEVKKGDSIGLSGSTGKSTGNHLHFEIKKNNISIDPSEILNYPQKILQINPIFPAIIAGIFFILLANS